MRRRMHPGMKQQPLGAESAQRFVPLNRKRTREHLFLRQSPERRHDALVNLDCHPAKDHRRQVMSGAAWLVCRPMKSTFQELKAHDGGQRRLDVEIDITRRALSE